MAGEAIIVKSPWFTAIGSSAPVADAMDTGARTSANDAAISATEKLFDLHDFELVIASGTPTQNNTVDLYRIPNGNAAGRTPTPGYLHQYVDSFVLDSATGSYYIYGVSVGDEKDTYITQNKSGATLTYSVNQRTRSLASAP